MQVSLEQTPNADNPLQLLLFVDKRPSSREQVRLVRAELKELREVCDFELQIIDVTEQPYLAEYFRLIATPTLIKIHPEPRQTLAGSNLVTQLHYWWPQWQRAVEDYMEKTARGNVEKNVEKSKSERVLMPTLGGAAPNDEIAPPADSPPTDDATSTESMRLVPLDDRLPLGDNSLKTISYSAEQIRLADEIFQLRRENEELQHQIRFKDQILAMLAHDLRNPLTAASIAIETLEMGYTAESDTPRLTPALARQLLKHARTQTRAIDRMITDILQAARGASAELQIHPQRLNLVPLCLDVLNHMEDRLSSKSLHITKDIPSDLPIVLADEERIRQVLINLLDNAIKYTPIGGTIQLSALHRTSQKIQVSICDSGPGIPPENHERIFEEHYRLQRDTDKDGYGIGLFLCRRIIRAHYGRIWVDSTNDEGSCFHFTLPVFQA